MCSESSGAGCVSPILLCKVGSTVIGVSLIVSREAVDMRSLSNSRTGVGYCSSNMLPPLQPDTFYEGLIITMGVGVELRAEEGVGFKFNRVNFRGEGRLCSLTTVIMGGI